MLHISTSDADAAVDLHRVLSTLDKVYDDQPGLSQGKEFIMS